MARRRVRVLPDHEHLDLRERTLERPQDVVAGRQVRPPGRDLGPQERPHPRDLVVHRRQCRGPVGGDEPASTRLARSLTRPTVARRRGSRRAHPHRPRQPIQERREQRLPQRRLGEVEQGVDLGHRVRQARRRPRRSCRPRRAGRRSRRRSGRPGRAARTNSTIPGSIAIGPDATAAETAAASASRNSSTGGAWPRTARGGSFGRDPRNESCGCTHQPAAVIASVIVKTSHEPSVSNATSVESGSATSRSAGMRRDARDQPVDALEHLARSRRQVARVADRVHDRPGPGDRATAPGGLQGRVEHRVAGPPRAREELRPPSARRSGAAAPRCPWACRRTCAGRPRCW